MLASMRLLSRVGPDVNRQRASLDEALAAIGLIASVRSLIGMDAVVSLEVGFSVEALFAP